MLHGVEGRGEDVTMTKPAKPDYFPDWNDTSIMYVTGGQFTVEEIKTLFPHGLDDFQAIEVTGHGYMRHEFIEDEWPQTGWIWYNHPKKGVIQKATRVRVVEVVGGSRKRGIEELVECLPAIS
jgi:hypothetical protein